MPSTIHILPEHLANKIAAGEVVQRPESAVKELLENAIDAHATSLSVIIKDGGKTLLQIIDNGVGMSEEDAEIAFLRHATSKISTYEDLEQIRTLGFRGEALASIAAVAHVELKTRRESDDAGTLLRIEGGEVKEKSKTGMPKGTSFTVKNIFYNTPARRQFLKSNNTEFKHIYDCVQRIALSHPHVAMEFVSDDDSILHLASHTIEERLQQLFGERHFATLLPLHERTELINVSGFIGKPDFARKSKVDQYIFMNSRYIVSRSINHAIFSGYEHLVEKGNFPFFLLFVELDPRKVDVNVHPSKMEVKFADEQNIYRLVASIVRKTLGHHDIAPTMELHNSSREDGFTQLHHTAQPRYFDIQPQQFTHNRISFQQQESSASHVPFADTFDIENRFISQSQQSQQAPFQEQQAQQYEHDTRDLDANEGKAMWQLHNKYILSQIRTGLMIIDQHVAHERILYERALARFQNAVPSSQQLLFPHTIELTPGDFTLAKELLPDIVLLGFELKIFGKNTLVLEGVPPDVKAGTEANILQDILDEFKNNQHRLKLEARDNLAKSFSCKAAIKAGDKLNEKEMRALIDQLFLTSVPYVCPHGRPVIVKISLPELDRRFMRT